MHQLHESLVNNLVKEGKHYYKSTQCPFFHSHLENFLEHRVPFCIWKWRWCLELETGWEKLRDFFFPSCIHGSWHSACLLPFFWSSIYDKLFFLFKLPLWNCYLYTWTYKDTSLFCFFFFSFNVMRLLSEGHWWGKKAVFPEAARGNGEVCLVGTVVFRIQRFFLMSAWKTVPSFIHQQSRLSVSERTFSEY